jgi:hypothetical protein
MKSHPLRGASILKPVAYLKEMIPGIELHHESLDGRGYPHGLKGDQIPMMARIVMVADTFDAMTTNRPYQTAMETEYVVRIINSLAKTKYDPVVVAALTTLVTRGEMPWLHGALKSAQDLAAASARKDDHFKAFLAHFGVGDIGLYRHSVRPRYPAVADTGCNDVRSCPPQKIDGSYRFHLFKSCTEYNIDHNKPLPSN